LDHLADSTTIVKINLDWPSEITETKFFEKIKKLPKAKTYPIF